MTKLLIVDDHALIRSGIQELLSDEPDLEVCGEAADVATALRLARERQPGLVIVDITLQGGDGLELIRQLRKLAPPPKILVVSMHDERIYASRVFRAGAAGYVNKNEPADRILEATRLVLAGKTYQTAASAEGHASPRGPDMLDRLSNREVQVLGLLAKGLTSRQIARQLRLSVKTVDSHREHIKLKLELHNANELVRFAVAWNMQSSAGAAAPEG